MAVMYTRVPDDDSDDEIKFEESSRETKLFEQEVKVLERRKKCRKLAFIIGISGISIIAIVLLLFGAKQPNLFQAFLGRKTTPLLPPPLLWDGIVGILFIAMVLNENLVKETADKLVSTGLAAAGYKYVVLDDCWQIKRDQNGLIQADSHKFPGGIKALADYIHNKGLKFGLYSAVGNETCQKRPGSYQFESQDAKTYAEWGVDFVKFDDCGENIFSGKDRTERNRIMSDALLATNRPIIFSVQHSVDITHAAKISNMRRVNGDIQPYWETVTMLIDKYNQDHLFNYSKKGFWNDLDMLEIGVADFSDHENIAHFALWCALKAPLILGNDVRKMANFSRKLLTHRGFLAINKDSLAKAASLYSTHNYLNYKHRVVSAKCNKNDTNQQWQYRNHRLRNIRLNLCLTLDKKRYLKVSACKTDTDPRQSWIWNVKTGQLQLGSAAVTSGGGASNCLTITQAEKQESRLRKCNERKNTWFNATRVQNWYPWADEFKLIEVSRDLTKSSFTYLFKSAGNFCPAVGGHPEISVFAGPLSKNRHVFVVFNRDTDEHDVVVDIGRYTKGEQNSFIATDVYTNKNIPIERQNQILIHVASHYAKTFILSPK